MADLEYDTEKQGYRAKDGVFRNWRDAIGSISMWLLGVALIAVSGTCAFRLYQHIAPTFAKFPEAAFAIIAGMLVGGLSLAWAIRLYQQYKNSLPIFFLSGIAFLIAIRGFMTMWGA